MTNVCTSCQPLFTLNSNICLACNINNCNTCYLNNYCQSCVSPLVVNSLGNMCINCSVTNCI